MLIDRASIYREREDTLTLVAAGHDHAVTIQWRPLTDVAHLSDAMLSAAGPVVLWRDEPAATLVMDRVYGPTVAPRTRQLVCQHAVVASASIVENDPADKPLEPGQVRVLSWTIDGQAQDDLTPLTSPGN